MTPVAAPAGAVRFSLNGHEIGVDGPASRRLLDVLRLDLGRTGTKEGCGEGECGACAVLVDGRLANACLVPVGQVHGASVVTVEGLGGPDGALDPLQRAFLDLGGTQCGMCAPGMLLAGRALLDAGGPVDEASIREAIAGNLCRCTGYTKVVASIAAAGEAASSRPHPHAHPSARGHARHAASGHPFATPDFERPTTLADALGRLAARPDLLPVAGGTDLMVARAPGSPGAPVAGAARPLLDLSAIPELHAIAVRDDELVLGAGMTWEALRRSAVVRAALPVLAEVAAGVGAVAIRERGTIGGNCVTASPAGDLLPVLLALDARLEAASADGRRTVDAAAFWPAYRRTALAPGELLAAIRIPLLEGREVRYRKVGTRQALAIAKASVAVAWRRGGGAADARWRDVRVAMGSVAPTPVRLPATEALLEGEAPSDELAWRAGASAEAEVRPIDDVRSTAAYRRAVAGRLVRRIVADEA